MPDGSFSSAECIGSAFAAWCAAHGWERPGLASWLGVTNDRLAAMALEHRATPNLAERFGADVERFKVVLDG